MTPAPGSDRPLRAVALVRMSKSEQVNGPERQRAMFGGILRPLPPGGSK